MVSRTPVRAPRALRPERFWLLLVGAAAALVQGVAIGRLPLWRDEIASVEIASRSVPAILTALGRIDVVHGLYYLLLHGVLLFGDSEVAVRLPSLACSVAAVALVAELARRRVGVVPATVAAALMITNPFLATYAKEARPYALGTALVCAAAFALLGDPLDGGTERPTRRRLVWFTVLAVAATYAHLFDGLAVAGLLAGWALTARPGLRRMLPGVAGYAVAVSPLVWLAGREAGQVSWIGVPTGDDVRILAVDVAGTGPVSIGIGVALVGAVLTLARRPPARSPAAGLLTTVAPAAVAAPAVLLAVSWLGHPAYVERYVLASVPMLALAAGAAVALLPGTRTVTAALVALTMAGLPAAWQGPASKTEDLRAAAGYLHATARPGDCVAYAPGWARLGVGYYRRRTGPGPDLRDVALDPGSAGRQPAGLFAGELSPPRVVANLRACGRVWVVGYPGPVGGWRPVPEVTTGALAVVRPAFTVGTPVGFDDVVVTLWSRGQPEKR